MTRIPDIKGMDIDEAREELKKQGIIIEKEHKKISLKTGRNCVIKTDPEIGEKVPEDKKIEVYVSRINLLPILILLLLIIGLTGLIYTAYYLSTRPTIDSKEGSDHGDNKVIEIEEDSKMISGEVDYYLYCVSSKKDINTCVWERTDTKNVVISKSGKWYVWFKAVSKEGEISAPSEAEEVIIDNEAPVINKLETSATTRTIRAKVEVSDNISENNKIYWSIDKSAYEEGKEEHLFEGLEPDTEYEVEVKVEDEKGNEYVLKAKVRTLKEEKKEEEKKDPENPENPDKPKDPEKDPENPDKPEDPEKDPENPDKPEEPEDPKNPDKPENPEETLYPPIINLSGIPGVIKIRESYDIPTSVWYDEKGGTTTCKIEDGTEVRNTSEIDVGRHTIRCVAEGNNGLSSETSKEIEVKIGEGEEEVFNGWIRLNLYYPKNSTNREYIIKNPEVVEEGYNEWTPYTGPILVNMDDIDNVYIKYNLNGKTHIESPSGRMVVLIDPESYKVKEGETTKVNIYYEEKALTKQYRINKGPWIDYEGEFEVSGNTLIEARGTKNEKVYDSNGNVAYEQIVSEEDQAYIRTVNERAYTYIPGPGGGVYPPGEGRPIPGTKVPVDPRDPSGPTVDVGNLPPGGYVVTDGPEGPEVKPAPEGEPGTIVVVEYPYDILAGPRIESSDTSERTLRTTITIEPEYEASKIYYSINDSEYKEYTGGFELTDNATIRAYYIRKEDGRKSSKSSYRVRNISDGPVINIRYSPDYLETYTNSTIATMSAKYNVGDIEYSFDGEIYKTYEGPIEITKSTRLYARAIDANGKVRIYEDLVNLRTAPEIGENLDISINATPEKGRKLVNSVKVDITYDSRATKRYYKLSKEENWQEYNGPITLLESATVYAYATGDGKDKGSATKKIDYLYDGIAEPTFEVVPEEAAPMHVVRIKYAENAATKKYSLDGINYYNYENEIRVYENCTIYAMNEDLEGHKAESTYVINNTIQLPKIQVIDQGKYLLVRLNYPEQSKVKEYKWKEDGIWKGYPETGILLIYPEFKDEFDASADYYKVEDKEGKEVQVSKEHTYVLDVLSSDIFYNLFMRWDSEPPEGPTFIKDTEEPAREVRLWINYDEGQVKKEYKIVYEDGTASEWQTYDNYLTITKNNAVVFARSMNEQEIYSGVTSIKITNIDEIAPEINVLGELEKHKRRVTFVIQATDDLGIENVGYLKGSHDEKDMKRNGIYVKNNTAVSVEENGIYTLIAIDKVGNTTIKEIEITNVDQNAPNIIITASNYQPENSDIYKEVDIEIDYDDAVDKKYSFDKVHWIDYNGKFTIKAIDVYEYANNNVLTIYAKGTDEAGNPSEAEENIYNLDLEIPNKPEIVINSGYPKLTENGVEQSMIIKLNHDTRYDLTNYYCLENCETEENWKIYKGAFKVKKPAGSIHAKSVKDVSNVEVIATKEYALPTNSLLSQAYDNDNTTYDNVGSGSHRLDIDASVVSRMLVVDLEDSSSVSLKFYDKSNNLITTDTREGTRRTVNYLMPQETSYVIFTGSNLKVYEVSSANIPDLVPNPVITVSNASETTKTVAIQYPSGNYTNEYSLNEGATWNVYNGTFTIDRSYTIWARSTKQGAYISSSTYYVGKSPYILTFNANGGSVSETTRRVIFKDAYGTLPTPTRNGYTFAGWFTDVNGGSQVSASTIMGQGDVTVYAHWNIDTYTISYILNGGTVATANPISYTIETNTITLNIPTQDGYDFLGWTGSNGTTPQTTVTIPKGSTGNRTYTANWESAKYQTTALKIGDTVNYSVTGNEGTISEWVVIKTGQNPELVSKQPSPDNFALVKEDGYNNGVKYLNQEAASYGTNTNIVKSTRHMGYYNQVETCTSFSTCPTDTNYSYDTDAVKAAMNNRLNPNKEHWLTSRNKKKDGSWFRYCITTLSKTGTVSCYSYTFTHDDMGEARRTYSSYTREKPIRPIITLQSSVKLDMNPAQPNVFTIIQ